MLLVEFGRVDFGLTGMAVDLIPGDSVEAGGRLDRSSPLGGSERKIRSYSNSL